MPESKDSVQGGGQTCRKCGQPMEPGFLAGKSTRLFAPGHIVWIDREFGGETSLTEGSAFGRPAGSRIAGFLCDDCGIIELDLRAPVPSDQDAEAEVEKNLDEGEYN